MSTLFDTYRQIVDILDEKVASVQTAYRAHLNCRKGCFSCCQNARFKIRAIEWAQLHAGFEALPGAQQAVIQENVLNPATGAENDCPALINGACGLYADRPLLCRAYGILIELGDKLVTCPLNFTDVKAGEALQKLDILPYYDLADDLSTQLWQNPPANAFPAASKNKPETAPALTIREYFETIIFA